MSQIEPTTEMVKHIIDKGDIALTVLLLCCAVLLWAIKALWLRMNQITDLHYSLSEKTSAALSDLAKLIRDELRG